MTPAQLDALLAYIDARIVEKALDTMGECSMVETMRRHECEDELRDAFKEEGERDGS